MLKKQNSFIRDSLVNLAKSVGIDLVKIDPQHPLSFEGPFDCVLHKLYGDDWNRQLQDFRAKNPNAAILDSPDAIELLHNRISMLAVVSELKIENQSDSFGIPKQIVIYDKETLFDRQAWELLKFLVIAKPLVADGSAKSHKMSLVYNHDGLNKQKPPIVLQEFVNHGGVIFKVYVVGEFVRCIKRKSLPDFSEETMKTLEGSLSFSQVSNLATHEQVDEMYYRKLDLEVKFRFFLFWTKWDPCHEKGRYEGTVLGFDEILKPEVLGGNAGFWKNFSNLGLFCKKNHGLVTHQPPYGK